MLSWKFWPEYLCTMSLQKLWERTIRYKFHSQMLQSSSAYKKVSQWLLMGWFSLCSFPTNASTDAPLLNRTFPVTCYKLRDVCSSADLWSVPLGHPELSHTVGERWLTGRKATLGSFSVISCDKAAISLIGMIPNKPLSIVLYNLQAFKEGSLPPQQLPEQPWHFIYKSF